jgi:hypothetical protein
MVAELKLLSGGAAHGLVNALSSQFEQETGLRIDGTFDAVGSMAAKLRAGAPADVVILTSGLIAALTEEGYVTEGSALAIGTVATAVAGAPVTPLPASPTPQGSAPLSCGPTGSISPTRSRQQPEFISQRSSGISASGTTSSRTSGPFRTDRRRCGSLLPRRASARSAARRSRKS